MSFAQPIFGFIILSSFVTMIAALMLLPAPAETSSVQLINTFMGLLAGMAASVVSFYFGSTTTSKAKDEAIQNLSQMPQLPQIPQTPQTPQTVAKDADSSRT